MAAAELDEAAGLTSEEAQRLLLVHGRNELADKTKPWYRLYAEQFVEPMPLVIWVAIVIELALAASYGEAWPDFAVLCALQFGNCTLSFYEANKAGNAVAALKASLKPQALAKRDGHWVVRFALPSWDACIAFSLRAAHSSEAGGSAARARRSRKARRGHARAG